MFINPHVFGGTGSLFGIDPDFEHVELLFAPAGVAGTNAFSDLSTRNRAASPAVGSVMALLAGSSSDKVLTGNGVGFDNYGISIGSYEDFCVEVRFKRNGVSNTTFEYLFNIPYGTSAASIRFTNSGGGSRLQFSIDDSTTAGIYRTSDSKAKATFEDGNYHSAAMARVDSVWYFFVDGVRQDVVLDNGSVTVVPSVTDSRSVTPTAAVWVGGRPDGLAFTGSVDTARLSVGPTGRYSATYVPSFPFLSAIDPAIDAYWDKVMVLAPLNGASGAIAFNDIGPGSIPLVNSGGGAVVSTAQNVYAGSGVQLNGSNAGLDIDDSTHLRLGSSDFTLEGFAQYTGGSGLVAGSFDTIFNIGDNTSSNRVLLRLADSSVGEALQLVLINNTVDTRMAGTATRASVNNKTLHYVVMRRGNFLYVFVDGVFQGTHACTGLVLSQANMGFGHNRDTANPQWLHGLIGGYRLTVGAARYSTANFTPPNAAYPNSVVGGDPYFASVAMLLHGEGVNGANTAAAFVDSSSLAQVPTMVGVPSISTTQQKFGLSSIFFNGSSWLLYPSHTAFDFTGDFTIDGWVYNTATSVDGQLVLNRQEQGTGVALQVNIPTSRLMTALTRGVGNAEVTGVVSNKPFPLNQWVHIAFLRRGLALRLFQNGMLVGEKKETTLHDLTCARPMVIGAYDDGANTAHSPLFGYVDDLRVTKGVARYVTCFTPPAGLYPAARPPRNYGWNRYDCGSSLAVSNDLVAIGTTTTYSAVRGVVGKTSGKHYFEMKLGAGYVTGNSTGYAVGVCSADHNVSVDPIFGTPGGKSCFVRFNGQYGTDGVYGGVASFAPTNGAHVFGISVDFSTRTIQVYIDNVLGITLQWGAGYTGPMFPAFAMQYIVGPSSGMKLLTKATEFQYSPPAGFGAWDDGVSLAPALAPPPTPSGFDTLFHFEGVDNGTVFAEEHGKVVSRLGTNVVTSTARSKIGTASAGGFGAVGSALRVESVPASSGDYAVGGWFYWDGANLGVNKGLFSWTGWEIYLNGSRSEKLAVWLNGLGTANILDGVTSPVANTWNFVLLERVGATCYLSLNGVVEASGAAFAIPGGSLYIGCYVTNSEPFSGNLDELFVKLNGNLYGGKNFAPPTIPFNP